ncbi:MAG: type II toxin-antitoxin system RelE family toxin [Solirubrobacteraceae bacterium]
MSDGGDWRLKITNPAARDIKRLDKPVQQRILAALPGLQSDPPAGDVKRLTGHKPPQWRLRVGDYRIRFNRDHDTRTVLILRVLPRGRAYRD